MAIIYAPILFSPFSTVTKLEYELISMCKIFVLTTNLTFQANKLSNQELINT